MTVKLLLIYLLVIAFSLVLLFISISGGKNLRRNEDILAGRFSEVNEADAANKNKTKPVRNPGTIIIPIKIKTQPITREKPSVSLPKNK